jgi:hypothetical protein
LNCNSVSIERANIDDGVYLEYMVKGRRETEPVILIHGSVIADANAPLLTQPILMIHYYMTDTFCGLLSLGD